MTSREPVSGGCFSWRSAIGSGKGIFVSLTVNVPADKASSFAWSKETEGRRRREERLMRDGRAFLAVRFLDADFLDPVRGTAGNGRAYIKRTPESGVLADRRAYDEASSGVRSRRKPPILTTTVLLIELMRIRNTVTVEETTTKPLMPLTA